MEASKLTEEMFEVTMKNINKDVITAEHYNRITYYIQVHTLNILKLLPKIPKKDILKGFIDDLKQYNRNISNLHWPEFEPLYQIVKELRDKSKIIK